MGLRRIANAGGQTFSDGVEVSMTGSLLYVSGQLPVGDDGEIVTGDAAAQAHVCFDNVERVLHGFGARLSDVVRITAYLTDLDDYVAYNRVRGDRFGDSLPASTAVQIVGLVGGAHLEVEAIAVLPDDRSWVSPTP